MRQSATGTLAVRPNTQIIMFTQDFANSGVPWPIFGAGARACQGSNFALPFIQLMHSKLLPYPGFQPHLGHRFSGRNNDAKWGMSETRYYIETVTRALFTGDGARNRALSLAEADAKAELEQRTRKEATTKAVIEDNN